MTSTNPATEVDTDWAAWTNAVNDFARQLRIACNSGGRDQDRHQALSSAHRLMHEQILVQSRGMHGPRRGVVMCFWTVGVVMCFWTVIEKLRDTLPTDEQGVVFERGIELLVAAEVTSRGDGDFFNLLESVELYAGIEFDDLTPFHDALRELRGYPPREDNGDLELDRDEDTISPEE